MDGLAVLHAWNTAWNARDGDALAGLAHEDIELVIGRGTQRGIAALRDAVQRQTFGAALHAAPDTFFAHGETFVAVGPVELRYVESGEVAERHEDAGAAFSIRDGRVARFQAYEDAAAALRGEGLTDADRVQG